MTAEECLQEFWNALMDGVNEAETELAFVRGAISALHRVGSLSQEQTELWYFRIKTCPDKEHGHNPGRGWCAYCGTLERPANDEGE